MVIIFKERKKIMEYTDNEVTRLKLKILALKESLATKVADYEEKIAEIRVDLTIKLDQLNARIAELEEEKENVSKES
jgi:uncharacterized protein YdcH (DUF465 family)